jgi:pimeloyl-ACP methyl ester carboxylesterase
MPKILANEINIYYEIHGDDNNPPIVLAGGLSRDHNIWNPVLPYLTYNYKVILFNNRGAADQTDIPEEPYNQVKLLLTRNLPHDFQDLQGKGVK